MFHRRLILTGVFALSTLVRAGQEFPAQPGEQVAAGQVIVKLKPGVAASSVVPVYIPGGSSVPLRVPDAYLVQVPAGTPSSASGQLAAHALVDFVEPNRLRHSTLQAPNDPQVVSQWALQAVQATQAWGLIPARYLTSALAGNGANRVKVAILDTGIDCSHPDFVNSGGTSKDAANGGQILFSASQAMVSTTVPTPACPWQDDFGHGTHVAGIVAAAANNTLGVAGLGFPLELIAFKVLDNTGSGFDGTIANAIVAATNAGAQVVSLSLGGAGYSQTLQLAVNYAWQHNTLVVAAAGNNMSSALFFPADANFAVGVSATDSSGNFASFSNFGNGVDIAAPGVSVLSTLPTYANAFGVLNYGYLSGTSMATPHVSALAGLLSMTTPGASAASVLQRIQQTATSNTLNGAWNQDFGYGIINAFNAISGTPRAASLGSLVGQITDTSANPINAAHIQVNSQTITVDSSGLYRFPALPAGTYSVAVSASGFTPQNLTATIAAGADTTLPVVMGVTYGKFAGVVKDLGVPAAGAIVQAISGGLIVATAVADINGQYALWVPGGGAFNLAASALSRSTATLTGQPVAAGGTTTVNLSIARFGTISGTVRDGSLNPIGNAQILISGPGFTAGAMTDSHGNYSSPGVPVGVYTVTCSATGFPDSVINNVVSSADTVTPLNIQMTTLPGSGNVLWNAYGFATVGGNGTTVQKTGGCDTCSDAGGISQQQISSGDGYFEFTIDADTKLKYVGLNDGSTTLRYLFGIFPSISDVEVRDGGSYRTDTRYVAGDVFRIQVTGGQVTYLKNGALLYTSSLAPAYPLAMRVNLTGLNSSFGNARVSASVGTTAVAAPAFSPTPGPYTSGQMVTISTTTPGASVRYTTNGTTPTETVGTLYSGLITVSGTTTFKAVAYKTGMTDSSVSSATYTITVPGPGLQNVLWNAYGFATVGGNGTTVQKTGGCDTCSDAGGISQQQITSGDGYFEFTIDADTKIKYVGLNDGGTTLRYLFSIFPSISDIEVVDGGSYRTDTRYVAGDVFRIQVTGGQVSYLKNGALLYTSSLAPVYPLALRVNLTGLNSSFGNARILP